MPLKWKLGEREKVMSENHWLNQMLIDARNEVKIRDRRIEFLEGMNSSMKRELVRNAA